MIGDQDPKVQSNLKSAKPRSFPQGWCDSTLATLTDRSEYGTSVKCGYENPGTPVLRIPNIVKGEIDTVDLKRASENLACKLGDELQVGDMLVCRTNGSISLIGKAAVVRSPLDEPSSFASYLLRFRFVEKTILPKWIHYFISSRGREFIEQNAASSAGQHNISLSTLHAMPIPVAPINEQICVVAKIEELFSDLDAGVANLTRVKATLKRYRAAVLKAAVEGKLTEDWRARHTDTEPASVLLDRILIERRRRWEEAQLNKFAESDKPPPNGWQQEFVESRFPEGGDSFNTPDEWAWTTVEVAGEVRLGRQRSPKNHEGPYMRPYLRVANVYEDRLDLSDVKQMNFTPKEYETFRLQTGDILLNEGQSIELVGRPAMYRGEVPGVCFQNTLVRFRANDGILTAFALIVFRAYLRNQKFQRIARWTVNIAHLGADRFAKMKFPVPPLLEQDEIVAEVERRLSVIDAVEAQVDVNLKRAARLRQGILKRAFDGRLVPQDPDDEPAEQLLARIRAQRQSASLSTIGSPRSRHPMQRRKNAPEMPLFAQDDGDDQGGEP